MIRQPMLRTLVVSRAAIGLMGVAAALLLAPIATASPESDADDAVDWYGDGDGDGYGDPAVVTHACVAPSGSLADNTDCDDAAADVHPGATELCNLFDDDCDGTVDESDADEYEEWELDPETGEMVKVEEE